jgi:hypothetical protein
MDGPLIFDGCNDTGVVNLEKSKGECGNSYSRSCRFSC